MENLINNSELVNEQYKNSENLNLRLSLHKYNVNKVDWQVWCFNQMKFASNAKILELGCGNGLFWENSRDRINNNWNITLSDFSDGMLKSAKQKLDKVGLNFKYEKIDIQNIPYGDESFDVVMAKHMLYHVPDIEKALSEIKRVLKKDGVFYATANSSNSFIELNEIIESFDSNLIINGANKKFGMESGQVILNKYFNEIKTEVFEGKIVVAEVEPIVSYVASTIKGSTILIGEKRDEFKNYIEKIVKQRGSISINTKACMFIVKK